MHVYIAKHSCFWCQNKLRSRAAMPSAHVTFEHQEAQWCDVNITEVAMVVIWHICVKCVFYKIEIYRSCIWKANGMGWSIAFKAKKDPLSNLLQTKLVYFALWHVNNGLNYMKYFSPGCYHRAGNWEAHFQERGIIPFHQLPPSREFVLIRREFLVDRFIDQMNSEKL